MSRQRLFDYDEAQKLHDSGLTYAQIGKRFGVTDSAIYFACNPEQRAKSRERSGVWQRQGRCIECGSPCSRTGGRQAHRCVPCAAALRATTVRADTLKCGTCKEWKPDVAFPFGRNSGSAQRRERHGECRECGTISKRAYRERTRVPCHGCGTPVNSVDRRRKDKPPECQSCANRRVMLARYAA